MIRINGWRQFFVAAHPGILSCLLILSFSSPASGEQSSGEFGVPVLHDDSQFTPVDQKLLIGLFSARVNLDKDGQPVRMRIIPGGPSMIAADENHPNYPYLVRWDALYWAHLDLLEVDTEYAELFARLKTQLINDLGYYASMPDGRFATYSLFLSQGVYHQILQRAGPSDLKEPSVPTSVRQFPV